MKPEQRFINFVKDLEKLSVKYNVEIKSIGGITIYNEGCLESIKYSKDYTSGDLITEDINYLPFRDDE